MIKRNIFTFVVKKCKKENAINDWIFSFFTGAGPVSGAAGFRRNYTHP